MNFKTFFYTYNVHICFYFLNNVASNQHQNVWAGEPIINIEFASQNVDRINFQYGMNNTDNTL